MMKNLGELIKKHIETNRLIKKEVAKEVGITPAYLSALFNQDSMDCKLFEKICTAIGMNPISAFSDEEYQQTANNDGKGHTPVYQIGASESEVQALHDLIAEKERLIQFLMKVANTEIGTEPGQAQ
ncbi:MAG: helix-turn-helix domain-containing protein [Bacteroides sp.]|nr:helix-turn-helix domain-containing protein [Bacteroides sp.]MCM1379980.1 helix-turn-helix domain-containing protein [Bacteroides sp.]MCM1446340.1 helix-turn-helix domain-containing protein [Prevotella sp.]